MSRAESVMSLLREHYESGLGLEWPAKFACNATGAIWPWNLRRPSSHDERDYLDDDVSIALAAKYLETRPEGGRFELHDSGMYRTVDRRFIPLPSFFRRKSSPARIHLATSEDLRDLVPDQDLHKRIGNTHNPQPGPLSQGGDT